MTKLHEVLDDLESIYWVLYHGASYFPRGDFFDLTYLFDEQGVEGGGAKKAFFTDLQAKISSYRASPKRCSSSAWICIKRDGSTT